MGKLLGTMIFLALLWPSAVVAELRVDSKTEYYDTRGTTVDDLQRSKRNHGPFWLASLRRTDAMTSNNVEWGYRLSETEEGCRLDRPEVIVHTLTTLPRWLDKKDAPRALQKTWDSYLAALKVHEGGHAVIALQHARKVEAMLKVLPPMDSCDDLDRQAKKRGNSILEDEDDAQEAYDARTNYGETQGVRLH